MKIIKIFVFCLSLCSVNAFSQYYNDYNYNGYNSVTRLGGVDRSIGRDYSSKKPSPEEIEKSKAEQVEKFMDKLKTALTLDELQYIAIKNEVVSSGKSIDIVVKKETNDKEKSDEVKAIIDKSDKIILSYLNPDQKDKYKAFKENMSASKKDKKDKKKDKAAEE